LYFDNYDTDKDDEVVHSYCHRIALDDDGGLDFSWLPLTVFSKTRGRADFFEDFRGVKARRQGQKECGLAVMEANT
jgi:hypothetical protein